MATPTPAKIAAGEPSKVSTTDLLRYRLPAQAPRDLRLQGQLQALDEMLRTELGIPRDRTACGVLALDRLRYAALRPDRMFYGASVPKIGILLGYFETHPDAPEDLPASVRRDLELMIKRSSNERAAHFSRIVGLQKLAEIYESPRYRLYDVEHGGGLWSGKHYGSPVPRAGDPLRNLSHAATVRQCLRFYLMMEQGRLVSPAASACMRSIFAAPQLEFHDDGFVRGLRGRGVTLIRKNGLYEEWHLDTARIEHAGHTYLLAAITEHPRGDDYLAGLASGVDEILCGQADPAEMPHELIIDEEPGSRAGAEPDAQTIVSRVFSATIPFDEVLPSWNVELPSGGGFRAELRVARRWDGHWSPWLEVGREGSPPGPTGATDFPGGRVDVDHLRTERRYDLVQYRVRATAGVHVRRFSLSIADRSGLPHSVAIAPHTGHTEAPGRADSAPRVRHLPVPVLSQRSAPPELAPRICSPTSVAMVLALHGLEVDLVELAERIHDPEHDLYGNWPRAVQAAFTCGVPGVVRHFCNWREVEEQLARGCPIVASIRAREGELRGAPYDHTAGHLLVITGFDERGDIEVNDPAAPHGEGARVYSREDLERVWLRQGGVAYLFASPSQRPPSRTERRGE